MEIIKINKLVKDKEITYNFLLLCNLAKNNIIKYNLDTIQKSTKIENIERAIEELSNLNYIRRAYIDYNEVYAINPHILIQPPVEATLYTLFDYYNTIIDEIGVYLLEDDNYYKIGKTTNIRQRLNQHKTSNPNLRLISFIPCNNPSKLEAVVLSLFKIYNIEVEVFTKNEQILKYFKNNE